MTTKKRWTPPFLVILLFPLLVFMLMGGAINLISLHDLHKEQLEANEQQKHDLERISVATQFNQDIGALQILVSDTLTQAAKGTITESDAYIIHTKVIDRLESLEQQFQNISGMFSDLGDAKAHFDTFKKAIYLATEFAVVNLTGAITQAYLAANSSVALNEHFRAVVLTVSSKMMKISNEQSTNFYHHTVQDAIIGFILSALLLIGWSFAARWLTKRLNVLVDGLSNLANGNVDASAMDQVQRYSREGTGTLRGMAEVVLRLREAVLARKVAQYELGERVKELSCLYDVFRITEHNDANIDDMLEAVACRLPAAMRFPDIAEGRIDHGGRRYGAQAHGERLTSLFHGLSDEPASVTVAYIDPLPFGASEAFLPEERTLIDAIAERLAGALDRRRILKAEEESQSLMKAIFDSSPYAIDVIDPESLDYVQVNPIACRLLGYDRDELMSLNLFDTQGEIPPEQLQTLTKKILAEGGAHIETMHRRKDGTRFKVDLRICVVKLKGRDCLVGLWRDITHEQAAADEIRRLSLGNCSRGWQKVLAPGLEI